MAAVSFEGVTKTYPDGTTAVNGLDLEITDGEFMVLVGPSGCGKTTALRMVAGLEDISRGVLKIGERIVNHVPSRDRDIAMVFQSYALYPHLSVYDNIAFGLRIKKLPKDEIDKRVQNAARILDLEPYLQRKPPQLSGGQRQRVAMGRAIVREPSVFLMDEPLSNLDAKLRVQMRAEISTIQRQFGVTTLYVTHDQVEAMTIGDRVAVMRKSRLQQVADPQTIYDHPANLFVASFVGSPSMNLFQATVERCADGFELTLGERRIRLDEQEAARHPGLAGAPGGTVVAGVRPERLGTGAASDGRRLRGSVLLYEGLGSDSLAYVDIEGVAALTDAQAALANDVEDAAEEEEGAEEEAPDLRPPGGAAAVPRLDPRVKLDTGDRIELDIAHGALYFFD